MVIQENLQGSECSAVRRIDSLLLAWFMLTSSSDTTHLGVFCLRTQCHYWPKSLTHEWNLSDLSTTRMNSRKLQNLKLKRMRHPACPWPEGTYNHGPGWRTGHQHREALCQTGTCDMRIIYTQGRDWICRIALMLDKVRCLEKLIHGWMAGQPPNHLVHIQPCLSFAVLSQMLLFFTRLLNFLAIPAQWGGKSVCQNNMNPHRINLQLIMSLAWQMVT